MLTKITLKNGKAFDVMGKAMRDLGSAKGRTAIARGMNHNQRTALTGVRRALVKQTSIKRTDVHAKTKLKRATRNHLQTEIIGMGGPMPLSYFGAKQFSYGVRAKVWGKFQQYKSAFTVARYGNAYVRTTAARGPIKGMYGAGIAPEMIKDDVRHTWSSYSFKLAARVEHEYRRMLP